MDDEINLSELVSQTVVFFSKVRVEHLDENWVNDLWYNGFADFQEYDLPVEEIFEEDAIKILEDISQICELWANKITISEDTVIGDALMNGDDQQIVLEGTDSAYSFTCQKQKSDLWTTLIDCNIQVRNILALIFLVCDKCIRPSVTLHEKVLGLCSSRLYFILLSIPGSTAFRIYQPNLYQLALNSLKLPKQKLYTRKRSAASIDRIDNPCKKVIRTNSYESEAPSEPDQFCDIPENLDSENIEVEFNYTEYNRLLFYLISCLKALTHLLEKFSLKRDHQMIENTVQRLVECTLYETDRIILDFELHIKDVSKLQSRYGYAYNATLLAFRGLLAICKPIHGSEKENYIEVVKYLMANILCLKAKTNQPICRKLQVIKDNAVSFVCLNLKMDTEKCLKGSRILVQQLCVRVHDRSEFRTKVAQSVSSILSVFPLKDYAEMNEWLQRFIRHQKVQYRVFGLELFGQLLQQSNRKIGDLPKELVTYISDITIVEAIFARCNDKASSVRTKALTVLASNIEKIVSVLKRKNYVPNSCAPEKSKENNESIQNKEPVINQKSLVADSQECFLSQYEAELAISWKFYREKMNNIVDMLHRRAKDFKVGARKAALQVMENLICLDQYYVAESSLKMFQESVRDVNVMVRKQAIQSITAIFQVHGHNSIVQEYWIQCVLPLVLDPETSVQEKCLEVAEIVLLQNIVANASQEEDAWNVLRYIASGKHQDLQRYLQKAIYTWAKTGKIRSTLVSSLKSHIGSERDPAVWLLLSQLALHTDIRNASFVVDYWNRCEDGRVPLPTLQKILVVLGYTSKYICNEKLKNIQEKLEFHIKNFTCPPELIAAYIETLCKLYRSQYSSDYEVDIAVSTLSQEIMKVSEDFLSGVILEHSSNDCLTEELIVKHLFTLGELAQLCPASIPQKAFLLIQSMITTSSIVTDADSHECESQLSQCPSSQLKKLVSPKIQAHAFITLGKLCLQNEDLAKQSVPALAKELESSEHAIIRNNVVVVMTDLCIRYTLLVDPYISTLSACLKDSSPLIRRQTLILLTQLLQEEYIKWKGTLFFRIVTTLIDEDNDIYSFAEYSLGYLLLRRQPHIFFQHFVECIFHFNCYFGHSTYNKFIQSDREIKLFSLKGLENREKRMILYKFMLEHMSDEERFNLNLKLCQDILSAVSDSFIPLNHDSLGLVQDCLAVLCCDEIKLTTITSCIQDDIDDGDAAVALLAKAKKKLISEVVKKNVIENIVPIVITLKHTFEKIKSPLLKDLMTFLRELLKDYKNEVKEIMAADKQLAKEIEFDLRRFEKQQEEEEEKMHKQEEIRRKEEKRKEEEEKRCRQEDERPNQENKIVTEAGNENINNTEKTSHQTTLKTPIPTLLGRLKSLEYHRLSRSSEHFEEHHDKRQLADGTNMSLKNSGIVNGKDKKSVSSKTPVVSMERLCIQNSSKTVSPSQETDEKSTNRIPRVCLKRLKDVTKNTAPNSPIANKLNKCTINETPEQQMCVNERTPVIKLQKLEDQALTTCGLLRTVSTPYTTVKNITFNRLDISAIPHSKCNIDSSASQDIE